MRALVFADRIGTGLAPLTDALPVPLLPVAGTEVLVRVIEELAAAGIHDLAIAICAQGKQTEPTSLGDGARWGIAIRWLLTRGEEDPAELWGRFGLGNAEPLLVLRGDLLRGPTVARFLDLAQGQAGTAVFGVTAEPRANLILLRPGCGDAATLLGALRWDDHQPLPTAGQVALPDLDVNTLNDLPAYHRANLDLVAGRLRGLTLPGRARALGLTAGRRAHVSPKSLKQGVAFVGANSRVDPEAELVGEVIIGDNVVVDRAATIRDSVVLPYTYVGELVEITNAIVARDHLIRVDTGAVLRVSDAFLLGGFERDERRVRGLDRILGLVLLVLSLPLWPAAALAAVLSGSGRLLTARVLEGNRPALPGAPEGPTRRFRVWEWATPIPVLRGLPGLLAVVSGDLRLVGVAPLTPAESAARTEDWQRVRDQAPVGLLGPTQLNLSRGAPLEERLLSDAFYARQGGWGQDVRHLWKGFLALFSADAWGREDAQVGQS
jgi:NDP-sugar pyrophosphorylase family protein